MSTPFATCTSDAEQIQKLPKDVDPYRPGFGPGPNRWFPLAPTQGNQVVPYVYGRCCFADMAAALQTVTNGNHRIYLAGWWIETGVKLRDPATVPGGGPALLEQYLRQTKGEIRAMVWKAPKPFEKFANNNPIAGLINGLSNGACVMDDKLPVDPSPGAHHQKLVIVNGEQGLIAFTGGMDLNNSRVNFTPRGGGYEPLHDVHVRLTGPAANALLRVFQERWEDHPETRALEAAKFGVPESTPPDQRAGVAFPSSRPAGALATVTAATPPRASRWVAVGRTYADLKKHGRSDSYRFAGPGEHTAWDMVARGIQTAARWIYLEDQYLTSPEARTALQAKLKDPKFEFLLIVLCRADIGDFPLGATWNNEYREAFRQVDPQMKRWRIMTLIDSEDDQRRQWCGSYVHSKTWVFDDEYAIVGTANCTRRSFTYDSEVVVGVADDAIDTTVTYAFARSMRINLWHKHLGVPHSAVRDYREGLKLWQKLPPTAMGYDYGKDVAQRSYELKDDQGNVRFKLDPAQVDKDKVRTFVDPAPP